MGSILDNTAHFAATESETKNSYSLGHHQNNLHPLLDLKPAIAAWQLSTT